MQGRKCRIIGETKECTTCNSFLPFADFYTTKCGTLGLTAECRKCRNVKTIARNRVIKQPRSMHRKWALKRKFGITPTEYDSILVFQGGVCAICKKPCDVKETLAVDHNHRTGSVRGLLCMRCNMAIGGFKDDHRLLLAAADYLISAAKKELDWKEAA